MVAGNPTVTIMTTVIVVVEVTVVITGPPGREVKIPEQLEMPLMLLYVVKAPRFPGSRVFQ